jgi:hypothetical protein
MKLYEPETWHAEWTVDVSHAITSTFPAFVAWIVTVKVEKCGNVMEEHEFVLEPL